MNKFDKLYTMIIKEVKKSSAPTLSSYKSDGKTSKMWILPDGKTVALKNLWHYNWILDNKTFLKTKYKVDFAKIVPDEQPIRVHAINNGFFRVNYEHNGGTLTVEGNYSHFTKRIKDSIFMIVADNLDYIDNINVTLMNYNGKVVKTGYSQLFSVPDNEKLDHIPLVTESLKKEYGITHYNKPKKTKKLIVESFSARIVEEFEKKGFAWFSPTGNLYPCKFFEHAEIIGTIPEFSAFYKKSKNKTKNLVSLAYRNKWIRLGINNGNLDVYGYKPFIKAKIPHLKQLKNQTGLENIYYSFIPDHLFHDEDNY